MKKIQIKTLNDIINVILLLILPILTLLQKNLFDIVNSNTDFFSYFLKFTVLLFVAFSLGESASVIYWFSLNKKNRQKISTIVDKLSILSVFIGPAISIIFLGSLLNIIRTFNDHIFVGLFSLTLGGLFGFSFSTEFALESTSDKKREQKTRRIFDHSLLDNFSYFILFPIVYLPLSWININIAKINILVLFINILLIIPLYFLGNLINKFIH